MKDKEITKCIRCENKKKKQHMKHQYEIMLNSTSFLGSALLHEERGDEPLRAGAGGHDQWGDEEWFKTQNIKLLLQVEKKGVIYFDDVCKLILRKFREDDEEEFIKIMFKVNVSICHLKSKYFLGGHHLYVCVCVSVLNIVKLGTPSIPR